LHYRFPGKKVTLAAVNCLVNDFASRFLKPSLYKLINMESHQCLAIKAIKLMQRRLKKELFL